MIRNLILACCTLLLAACTTFGPVFVERPAPSQDQALVYVYRPNTFAMSALTALIYIDGQPAARIKNEGYVALRLTPGEHTITQHWKVGLLNDHGIEKPTISISHEFPRSSTSFLRLSEHATLSAFKTRYEWELQMVSGSVARAELAQCRLGKVENGF